MQVRPGVVCRCCAVVPEGASRLAQEWPKGAGALGVQGRVSPFRCAGPSVAPDAADVLDTADVANAVVMEYAVDGCSGPARV